MAAFEGCHSYLKTFYQCILFLNNLVGFRFSVVDYF